MKRVFAMMFAVALAGQFISMSEAVAQEEPTPEENVCAPLDDPSVTKGLLGLCLAYCQDDGMVSGDLTDKEITKALKKSNKILKKYNKKKTSADPDMPCIHTPCPCWTSEQMAEFGVGEVAPVSCQNVDGFYTIAYGQQAGAMSAATAGEFIDQEVGSQQICSIQDLGKGIAFKRIDGITAEESDACITELVNQCFAFDIIIE